jgi:hypothetical protein
MIKGFDRFEKGERMLHLVFMFLVLILIIMMSLSYGKSQTSEIINPYTLNDCQHDINRQWESCAKLVNDDNGETIISGLLFSANESRVAFYDGETTQIISLKPDYRLLKFY